MTNTIRSKIARLADRRMWRKPMGEIVWRGETPDGNEIETADPIELLNEILEQIDAEENNLYGKLVAVQKGTHEILRTRNRLPGIIPHGLQIALFEPIFLEAGTTPASTHKGGRASAK